MAESGEGAANTYFANISQKPCSFLPTHRRILIINFKITLFHILVIDFFNSNSKQSTDFNHAIHDLAAKSATNFDRIISSQVFQSIIDSLNKPTSHLQELASTLQVSL